MKISYSTDRLVISILQPAQAGLVLDFYTRNRSFLEIHEPKRNKNFYSLEFHRANLTCEYNAFFKKKYMRFWIFTKENTSRPAGTICFSNFQKGAFLSCMVGYKLDKDYCGKGYMHEALSLLIPVLCREYPIHRIEAMVMPDNISSIRLLTGLNFIREGYLHSYAQINGKWEDHMLFTYISNES